MDFKKKTLIALIAVLSVVSAVFAVLVVMRISGGDESSVAESDENSVSEYSYDESMPEGFPSYVSLNSLKRSDLDTVSAAEFVNGIENNRDFQVYFDKSPDMSAIGEQDVYIAIVYFGTKYVKKTTLNIFHIESDAVCELEVGKYADIRTFIPDSTVAASFIGASKEELSLSVSGNRKFTIGAEGRAYEVFLTVKDTTAPSATVISEYSVCLGEEIDPSVLITSVVENSGNDNVTVTFDSAPIWQTLGDYSVSVKLADKSGNVSVYPVLIHIINNPPSFEGLSDMNIMIGETISYRSGVKAYAFDGSSLSVSIDASTVDNTKAGVYYAVYSATDSTGAVTKVKRKITVTEVTKELVDALCYEVIDKIIPEGSSRDTQIRLVWKWTWSNIKYIGTSNKTDILHGAYEGLARHSGDCYTYYAVNAYMFDLLGIENTVCERVGGTTHHWWNLVKFSDGVWYHVDSCAHPVSLPYNTYKMSDEDLAWFADVYYRAENRINYYTYDKTLSIYSGLNIATAISETLKNAVYEVEG